MHLLLAERPNLAEAVFHVLRVRVRLFERRKVAALEEAIPSEESPIDPAHETSHLFVVAVELQVAVPSCPGFRCRADFLLEARESERFLKAVFCVVVQRRDARLQEVGVGPDLLGKDQLRGHPKRTRGTPTEEG